VQLIFYNDIKLLDKPNGMHNISLYSRHVEVTILWTSKLTSVSAMVFKEFLANNLKNKMSFTATYLSFTTTNIANATTIMLDLQPEPFVMISSKI